MILVVFGVLQVILIQVVFSAQLSTRDQSRNNIQNYLENTPLAGNGRSRRQINNPPDGLPVRGDFPVNGFSDILPFRNGMPFSNLPLGNGLTDNFGVNIGLESNLAFNNGLPKSFGLNNGMVLPSNSPFNFPLPNLNIAPQIRVLPNINGINFNESPDNIPNALPSFNNVPNALPCFNNEPNRSPSFNIVPNGLPNFNNVPNILPSFNNMPNGLPSFNNVPNGLPSSNNVVSGLPNINNLSFDNKLLNLNNVPVGQNILNLNNLPAANSLPNINNILPIYNVSPSLNNLPCSNALPHLPLNNGSPLNSLPSGNPLPSINKQLPYLDNFRITEIGIGNGIADINRYPRNGLSVDNTPPTAYILKRGNELILQVPGGFSNINNYQKNNEFSGFTNTPHASRLPNKVPDNIFSSINYFPIGNTASNIASVAQSINNMQLNNGLPDISNYQNFNVMPVSEQSFIKNVPFNNELLDANNYFPATAAVPSSNSRLVNVLNNGKLVSNGGYLNEILFTNKGLSFNMPERETCSQNSNGHGFSSNDFQLGNAQVPVNNWHYDFEGAKMPIKQNVLPEGEQIFSNVLSDYQSLLMPNNLNLAQELIKNLKVEGNMPFLNGLPVAGITETVTVLNGPCSI